MPDTITPEDRIQSMADILSLVAIIGRVDNAAIQRVLVNLGASLFDVQSAPVVDREMARKLLVEIVREAGEDAALHIASDLTWVSRAWQPVLQEYSPIDPYHLIPFAEIIYALVNHTGVTLQQHDTFDRFGGPDVVLPLQQLTSALSSYVIPQPSLKWELVGFTDPPDQALVASDAKRMYLFKSAASANVLRFSELERDSTERARQEHDVKVDSMLFASFVAGLLGDMLYWSARLRSHSLPGNQVWLRIQRLLSVSDGQTTAVHDDPPPPKPSSLPPEEAHPEDAKAALRKAKKSG